MQYQKEEDDPLSKADLRHPQAAARFFLQLETVQKNYVTIFWIRLKYVKKDIAISAIMTYYLSNF